MLAMGIFCWKEESFKLRKDCWICFTSSDVILKWKPVRLDRLSQKDNDDMTKPLVWLQPPMTVVLSVGPYISLMDIVAPSAALFSPINTLESNGKLPDGGAAIFALFSNINNQWYLFESLPISSNWNAFTCMAISTVCSPIKAKWQLSLQLRYLHFFWPRHSIEQAILRLWGKFLKF